MIKKILISILIKLISKDLFDYSDLSFENYYMTYYKVGTQIPEFIELKKRQLGKLHITSAMELDPNTKMMWIGQIMLLKKELDNLKNAENIIEEFKQKPNYYKQMKSAYKYGEDILKSFIKRD